MIEVRAMGEADLPEVALIQREAPEAAQWAPADYLAYTSYVAVETGRVVGYGVAQRLGEEEAELLTIAVAKRARRRGVGRMLLNRIIALNVSAIHLEVRASNEAAQYCYISVGFQATGRRRGYYAASPTAGQAREDAVVMKYKKC
jgi:ribosomal protein S18 acetylase RimI-like enzyme